MKHAQRAGGRPFDPAGETARRLLPRAALGAFALGALHQWLFLDQPLNLAVPLFFLLLHAWYFAVAGWTNRSGAPFARVLLLAIGLLVLHYLWSADGAFWMLNLLALPFLAAFHAMLHAGRLGKGWYRREAAAKALAHLVPIPFRNMPVPFRHLRRKMEGTVGRRRLLLAGKIALGGLIALPVAAFVSALLASADKAFARVLSAVPDLWAGMHPAELLFRGLWISVVFLYLFGFTWGLLTRKAEKEAALRPGAGERFAAPAWPDGPGGAAAAGAADAGGRFAVDPVIAHTVLFVVNAVYALFVAVQFSYLFGAWDGVLPDGQTYAEHARSGFFELAFAAAINFLLLAAALAWSRPAGEGQARLQRWLLTALLAATGIMLASSHIRLSLYEQAYGYTEMRLLVHAFLLYMAALLAAALYRVWRDGASLVRLFAVISLAAWVAVNYAGVDRQVAERNIARYEAGGELDTAYLIRLSDDAVPALLPLMADHPEVRADLERRYQRLKEAEWPTANLNWSRYRALRLLERALR